MKKLLIITLFILLITMSLVSCEGEANKVSHNLSLEADNFNIIRQVTILHGITGETTMQMTGRLSIEIKNDGKLLEVIVEHSQGQYAKHFFLLGDNGQASIEQIGPASVDQYNYTLNVNPKLWFPVSVDVVD